jgi:hypothetical protein
LLENPERYKPLLVAVLAVVVGVVEKAVEVKPPVLAEQLDQIQQGY